LKKVVVIGAGMSGLACAWALRGKAEVIVLEAGERVGGNVITAKQDGFVMDAGPDAWVTTKPDATALARELGLEGEMIGTRPEFRRVYVAWKSRLHPMPEGVVLGVPTKIAPMVTTPLFSLFGKARMGLEPFVPSKKWEGDEDESIGAFVERRLGREATDRLAAPLLGGIFAGDAQTLSIRAAFPQFVEQEKKYGSLIRAMRASRKGGHAKANGKSPGGGSAFLSLRSGMSLFPETLAGKLDVRMSTRADAIARRGDRWEISTAAGKIECDAIVFATPPPALGKLIEPLDGEASKIAKDIRCGSSAAVFLAYKRGDVEHPLDATGFVVPRSSANKIVACTFVSSKWEGRAPEGHVLLRAFVGGAGRESALDASDGELVSVARGELASLMGRLGEPVLTRVFRHVQASPQPEVGHIARMRTLSERIATLPNVHVIGNGYFGTGIPDCIKQANAVAAKIA
jgi:oxygen-dependent protoporphyrinogen oxidase